MKKAILFLLLSLLLAACERPDPADPDEQAVPTPAIVVRAPDGSLIALPTPTLIVPTPTEAPAYIGTPTPDPPHYDLASIDLWIPHSVTYGENLGYLAELYDTTVEALLAHNGLDSDAFLYVGQLLEVPGGAELVGSSFKIVPNSELVFGPGLEQFDITASVTKYGGYLLDYQENIEGVLLSGPEIVQLVANRYSVNPRLLLAVLEHRSQWVTSRSVMDDGYPMGHHYPGYDGLYQQLGWAANRLNWGYYARADAGVSSIMLGNGTRVALAPDINHGTAGVQYWLGSHDQVSYGEWMEAIGPLGFYNTYTRLFGNPFQYTFDPLMPANLHQPAMVLPWPKGETWYFTGGPHGGWAGGSAWAALDFVPLHEMLGCYESDSWVTAVAPGVVTRSDFGAVVVDLDQDGYAGTGWAVIYMHVATNERVPVGRRVQRGDRIGHPSCEGGYSNGTHLHIARTYNGRWISASGTIPFVMDGWSSQGLGREYDGLLLRGDEVREACECRDEMNELLR